MKPLSAGSEIDAWCTKCRLELTHRIIAMVSGRPRRVKCSTCGSDHNYRSGSPAVEKPRTRTSGSASSNPPRRSKAEADRIRDWETHVRGSPSGAFRRYSMDARFEPGSLVLHQKFGEGYVTQVFDDGKVAIMFRDGLRTLIHGQV